MSDYICWSFWMSCLFIMYCYVKMNHNYCSVVWLTILFTGAFGYFEVTHDITQYCCAKVFEKIGKRSDIFVRFSTVGMLGTSNVMWYCNNC